MILSFSGDPFLARRAARRALAEQGFTGPSVTEFGEGMTPETVLMVAAQGGLFAGAALLLDFGAAFQGQAGTRPRNEMISALAAASASACIVIVDPEATATRQKSLAALGEHRELAAPRYERLPAWVADELKAHGVSFDRDAAQVLADLFGEEPAMIAAEIEKLAALDEHLTAGRVRALVNRPAAHDAFDLIDAITEGDGAGALAITRQLIDEGEAPQRVLGALSWQLQLVAKAVGLLTREAPLRPSGGQAAAALKVRPFVAQRALKLAGSLDEAALAAVLAELLDADVRSKTGSDPELALETLVVHLSGRWARRAPRR